MNQLQKTITRFCIGVVIDDQFQYLTEPNVNNLLTFQTIETALLYILQTYSKEEIITLQLMLFEASITMMFGKIVDMNVIKGIPNHQLSQILEDTISNRKDSIYGQTN